MKKCLNHPNPQGQRKQISVVIYLILFTLLTIAAQQADAQCTGGSCNSTINANGSFSIPAGQTYCLQKNNYTGTITFNNGSILCIGSGINWNSALFTFTGTSGTINNYGASNYSFTLPSAYTFNNNSTYSGTLTQSAGSTVNNSSTFSGTLTQNGGTFTNNSTGTISGNSTINGTLTNNGIMNTGAITISGSGTLTNNLSITSSISNIVSGGTFTNAAAGTYSGSIASASGSTINNSGSLTHTGGIIAGTTNVNAGTLTNNGGISISGAVNVNTGGTISNSGTLGGALTINSGGTVNNNSAGTGTINGPTTVAGTLTNNGIVSGTTTISAGGVVTTGSNLSGTVIVNGTFNVSSGASPSITSVTVNSGGIVNNNGTIQNGSFTANAGSVVNNYGILHENSTIQINGTLTNYNGGNIQTAISGNAGSTITNNSGGQITAPITVAGILNNNNGGIISNPVTESAGGVITNDGSMSAGATVNGGTFVESSTGTITNGGTYNMTVNGGTVTLNSSIANISMTGGALINNATNSGQINVSGGVVTNTGSITGSYTQNGGTVNNVSGGIIAPSSLHLNSGTDSITNGVGSTLTFPSGTNPMPSGLVVTNFGTFNTTSPLTISAGATLNLQGTQNMSAATVSNAGTINLAGSLTIAGYSGTGAFNEISGGCNTFTTGSNTGTTVFNGGNLTYGGGLIVNTSGGILTNGASATIAAPAQQATAPLNLSFSSATVNGSFTSPNATIAGYIVLRYIGLAPTSDNPANYTTYAVGNTVGSSTVAAIIPSFTVLTRTFTDNIPSGNCGKNVYYRIFAYNGAGACESFNLTNPLTGSIAVPVASASISPSGATTFCAGGGVTLTASGGGTYTWSTGANTAALGITSLTIASTSTTTYTVTVTNATGCTASANRSVTVNANPTAFANNATICAGGTAILTATGGSTYAWSTGSSSNPLSVSPLTTTNYTVTVTNASTCTASFTDTVTVNPVPTPSITGGAICSGAATTLTASGGSSYVWSTGASTTSISTSIAATYTVTATGPLGCTASASRAATAYTSPTVTASSNSPISTGSTINFTSSPSGGSSPYSYSWSGPASFTSAIQNPSIASATSANTGSYSITVTDNNTCTATASTTVALLGPGGTSSNLQLWLRSNAGLSQLAGNVLSWSDQSGFANNASTINGVAPTYSTNVINSYPVINFAGTGGLQGAFNTALTSSNVSAFIVTQVSSSSANPAGVFSIVAASPTNDGNTTNSAVMFHRTGAGIFTTRNSSTLGGYNNAAAMGQYHIFTSQFSATQDLFYYEGKNSSSAAFSSSAFNATRYALGSRLALLPSIYMTGQMAEVILYDRQVSAAEKNQIESYLAVKYGITLDQSSAQNYTSSAGTIFWNAASNGTYKNNIFGVGIDNNSSLSQTSSVSINTAQLSISNAISLTNNSYLMASDNAGSMVSTITAGLPNSITEKIGKTWRTSQTGTRTSAQYAFDTTAVTHTGYFSSIASNMIIYMLIDSNADGTYESYVTANSKSGSTYSFLANMPDGALFTFGYKAPPIDYGDAFGVATTIASNGAGHVITSGIYLGSLIDAENDGQPSVNAAGDDSIGVNDDDGVNFNIGVPTNNQNILQIGTTNTIQITASTSGYIKAWIDYDGSNTYDNTSEYALINVPVVAGSNTVTFNIPDSVSYGNTSMRFRFSKNIADVTGPTGLAPNGEVEDYKVFITAPLVAPCTNGFQNPSFEMGPYPVSYIITGDNNLHYWRTTAADRQIEVWKSGFNGVPAYQGSYFVELNANMPGALYQDVYTTPGTVVLWHFAHRGRSGIDSCNLKIGAPGATVTKKVVGDGTSAWGIYTGSYTVPANQYITRFEFNALYSVGGLSYGNFIDDMYVSTSFDYGDAPNTYGTLKTSNGPYHAMTGNLYLGTNVSCDADGQPSATGANDTYDDGLTFPAVCNSCNSYTVNISAFNNSGSPATIAGWIDFNKNGVFDATERASVTIPSSASQQTLTLTFNTTLAMLSPAPNGSLFGRFRIAVDSTEIASPTGFASSGEVEDYLIPCSSSLTLPVPSSNTPVCTRSTLNLSSTTTSGAYYFWRGPNGFAASGSTATITNIQLADSGLYRVYSVYANGCETDSAITHVVVNDCYISVAGAIFDDANGNGLVDGTDVTTTLGQTIYAVIVDNNNNKVLSSALIASNGTFTISNVPAYMAGMTFTATTVNYSNGATSGGSQWPSNWVGTIGQYGSNNSAGSGMYSTSNSTVPVASVITNISGLKLGYDRLPVSTARTYYIAYPTHNAVKQLTTTAGFGALAGSDPEDGTMGTSQKFTITNLSGLNGNSLYYDLNGNGVPDAGEQITGYTTIVNYAPSKLLMKFTGSGSTSASFKYGSTDAAAQTDPAPATYFINWSGALPVKLISFNAQKKETNQSLLSWSTATEIDNDHFEVERSADAQNWEKIGEVKGNGTTSSQHDYSLIDERPISGINYYRLKQVDVDGKFEYSNIEQLEFDNIATTTATLAIYPNPMNASGTVNLELSNTEDNISTVSMTNAIGQLVYINELPQVQHANLSDLNLPQGVYIVSIQTTSNKTLTTRLVIQ